MALKDIQKDSRLYSGWNRYKVIAADLIPIGAGITGGIAGSAYGVPTIGALSLGVFGDYMERIYKSRDTY